MKSLKKFSKKQLIELVRTMENDINRLNDELELLSLVSNKTDFIYKNSDDDKTITYLKNRLKCVKGIKRIGYMKEYNRLMDMVDEDIEMD